MATRCASGQASSSENSPRFQRRRNSSAPMFMCLRACFSTRAFHSSSFSLRGLRVPVLPALDLRLDLMLASAGPRHGDLCPACRSTQINPQSAAMLRPVALGPVEGRPPCVPTAGSPACSRRCSDYPVPIDALHAMPLVRRREPFYPTGSSS